MEVGDLAEFAENPKYWGIAVGIQTFEYEVYWFYGDRSWIVKKRWSKNVLDFFRQSVIL